MLLELIGLTAAELFDYNRENFSYDQETRLKRDLSRVEMQIGRFDLFRQDIEDLVKFTVDKMDMYHLVGALFLSFTSILYVEGRIHGCVVPPFYLGVYFLSVAGSFGYLLLAVWLSMHASISAHSFGVRVRTRHVRLPIPSLSQIAGLTAKLSDFEQSGVKNMFRLPFTGDAPNWRQDKFEEGSSAGSGKEPSGQSRAALGAYQDIHSRELLSKGEAGFGHKVGADDLFAEQIVGQPGKHIQLFRKLQAKWQCFDAYARVCMALGVNQMAQSISYYLIGVFLVQRDSISTAIALVFVFQGAALSLFVLDITLTRRLVILSIQLLGSLPAFLTLVAVCIAARDETNGLALENEYYLGPVTFFVEVLYFEAIRWLAKPSMDEAALPRRFRAVLFLDVFADGAYDPTDAENADEVKAHNQMHEANAAFAEHAISDAWMALRRWEAIPESHLSTDQSHQISNLRNEIVTWRRMLRNSLSKYNLAHGREPDTSVQSLLAMTAWSKLSKIEQETDPYANVLLGNLPGGRLFDLESMKAVALLQGMSDKDYLTLEAVAKKVKRVESTVGLLVSGKMDSPRKTQKTRSLQHRRPLFDSSDSDEDDAGGHLGGLGIGGAFGGKFSRRTIRNLGRQRVAQKERLPWKTVSRFTRMLQFCWMLLGVIKVLELIGVVSVDIPVPPDDDRRRRLGASPRLVQSAQRTVRFERLEVQWPYGAYFRPESLTCLPAWSPEQVQRIYVGSSTMLYQLGGAAGHLAARSDLDTLSDVSKFELRPALPRGAFPVGAVAMCGPAEAGAGDRACLWGALEDDGVAVWTFGERRRPGSNAVLLPLHSERPWRHFTGAIAPCRDAARLQPQGVSPMPHPSVDRRAAEAVEPSWCLLLAGWDGESLPVAVVPLSSGPSMLPSEGAAVSAYVDAPLAQLVSRATVSALHLSAGGRRLWAVLFGGHLQAWDLHALQVLGLWGLLGPTQAGEMDPVALCEDPSSGRLMLAAVGAAGGPQLLQEHAWREESQHEDARGAAVAEATRLGATVDRAGVAQTAPLL